MKTISGIPASYGIAIGPAFAETIGDPGGALQAADQGDDIHLSLGERAPIFGVAVKRFGRTAGWRGGLTAVNRGPGSICHRWLFGCGCCRVNRIDALGRPQSEMDGRRFRIWIRRSSGKRRAVFPAGGARRLRDPYILSVGPMQRGGARHP